MTTSFPFVLCADDYGLAPGVGAGVRELIEQGRLSATSCMTAGPHWRSEARLLAPLAERADIGLHFTLTDQPPAGVMPRLAASGRLPSVGRLMATAYAGGLDKSEIAAEFQRQLQNFTDALGRAPDFIDGHQHAHLLPVVRDIVAEAAGDMPGLYIRSCVEPISAVLARGVAAPKALLLSAMGRRAAASLAAAGAPVNQGFRGVYDLTGRIPYAELMARFLTPPRPGMLIMVHPGYADDALRAVDRVVEQREAERAFLAGPEFGELLARVGASPRRFAACF